MCTDCNFYQCCLCPGCSTRKCHLQPLMLAVRSAETWRKEPHGSFLSFEEKMTSGNWFDEPSNKGDGWPLSSLSKKARE